MEKEISKPLLKYEVFGNPIGSIGNCYYFISSLRKLLKSNCLKTWENQRSLDKERVNILSNHFLEEFKKNGNIKLRGAILLCKKNELLFLDEDEKYYIIDGQHRLFSLHKLITENKIIDINVRIDILLVNNENEIREEFQNINKSVPVPLHYLTPSNIIDLCCNRISSEYKKAFVDGKCQRPSIDINKFKDAIIKDNIIEKYEIYNSEELYNIIMKVNDFYKNTGSEKMQDILGRNNKAERKVISNCFAKCKNGEHLYYGLFKDTNWTVGIDRCKSFFSL